MNSNSPLDFLLLENTSSDMLFGDNDTNEVMLPEDMPMNSDEESEETPEEENLEHSNEPRDIISELQRKISDLKEEITSKLKPLFPESEEKHKNMAEALDDATSALDSALHHLTDIDNDISGDEEGSIEEPSQDLNIEPLEDASIGAM